MDCVPTRDGGGESGWTASRPVVQIGVREPPYPPAVVKAADDVRGHSTDSLIHKDHVDVVTDSLIHFVVFEK